MGVRIGVVFWSDWVAPPMLQSPGGRGDGTWYIMLKFIITPPVYKINNEKGKYRQWSCCTRPAAAKKRIPPNEFLSL